MILAFKTSAFTDAKIVPWALAAIHTVFNVANTLILIWAVPFLIKVAGKLVKHIPENDSFRINYISKTIFSTSEISLLQANKELVKYSKRVKAMFKTVKSMFNLVNEEEFNNAFKQISNFETICNQMEIEISTYLTKIGQGELSMQSNERLKVMMKIISNLENIADNCYNISKTFNKKKQAKIWFTQDIRNNINEMLQLLDDAIEVMHENLSMENSLVTLEKAEQCEERIDQLRNTLKEEYSINRERGYKYEAGVIYNDIYTRCERLGDHIFNITQVIVNSNKASL